jgi:2-haloacid dehalogenase
MAITLGFDVYGTLIDTAGITTALRPLAGERAPEFARQWREKQLEYSFRRALMRKYVDFAVCTAQALEYTSRVFRIALAPADSDRLLSLYKVLPAFADVVPGLAALKPLPVRLFAFSNGRPDDIESLLRNAGIRNDFEGVASLFDARTFKPDPAAYAYFHTAANTRGGETWLVSSNPFDVIGAISAGMKAAWVRRSPEAVFDPWEIQPTAIVASISELAELFRGKT